MPPRQPEVVMMKLLLVSSQAYFESPDILPERTMAVVLNAGKGMLERSQHNAEVRYETSTSLELWRSIASVCILMCSVKLIDCRQTLGHASEVWAEFTALFAIAIPALEVQSFASHDPISPTHNGSSSTLMAMNHATLMHDLERLNDFLTIARNVLASTKRAQNLAADLGLDQQILKLVDVCVRVTARGYDGEAGTRSETQWASVVGSCMFYQYTPLWGTIILTYQDSEGHFLHKATSLTDGYTQTKSFSLHAFSFCTTS